MAAFANLNLLAGGATLSTTTMTTTSNTLHLPASNTIGGTSTLPVAAPPPVTAASTATVGTPSTTSSITITTLAPSTAGSTPAAMMTMTTPSHAKRPVIISMSLLRARKSACFLPGMKRRSGLSAFPETTYNDEEVHVTPLAGSCFDVSIEDEWGTLDWSSDDEDSFVTAMSQA
ncbi:uncharacterized protein EV420DRAFT_1646336 [Desarmillaria tabescens]|uniref:Uncharacterized protein n=1 Tax=Armillaria tabescens TaxID=1929756 RepID=A0AA39MZ47_ARMTA|nr:uncharacterized protein EV420DRAFT_1646336 [Desarmillaria tabescens]KAK0451250.1 hypothetical protein EV420DRAFT_1646336 [Desarmillaria tabescens]